MNPGKVVRLSDYRAERLIRLRTAHQAHVLTALPDGNHLWELMDRNISLKVWEKGI
jgi:hypothetical protein